MRSSLLGLCTVSLASILAGCSSSPSAPGAPDLTDESNPFLHGSLPSGKGDTAYMNPDGREVKVDLEGDVDTNEPDWNAPVDLGQYALTYLRKREQFYIESLAEDATSGDRAQWQVDGRWLTAQQLQDVDPALWTHFRIRGVNAVLMNKAAQGVKQGDVFTAIVPYSPTDMMQQAGGQLRGPGQSREP